jgi:CRP/FNR family transcriptional regulator
VIGLIQKPALRLEGAVATLSVPPAKFDERIGHGQRIIDAAFGKLSPRRIPAGTRLFGSDGGGDLVYRLSGGWACRAVDWLDGRRAIVEIYLPGDMVGLEAAVLGRPVDEIIAVTALAVQAIDAQMLAELMAQPPAAAAILWLRAGQQRRVDRLAAALARRDAHERLALMLVDLYDRLCERGLVTGSSYPLPLTQQQIGDHLGLTLVHVNRVLRSLREKEIVSVDRHVVTIRDLDRLRQLAASARTARGFLTERSPGSREPRPNRAGLDALILS